MSGTSGITSTYFKEARRTPKAATSPARPILPSPRQHQQGDRKSAAAARRALWELAPGCHNTSPETWTREILEAKMNRLLWAAPILVLFLDAVPDLSVIATYHDVSRQRSLNNPCLQFRLPRTLPRSEAALKKSA